MARRPDSSLTVTDIFCGAGGNTIGAKAAGLKVKVGLNHWHRAIETYGANNPEVDQIERVDVSLCDPRRYHSTDIAIMSPECTTHSPAGGSRHRGSHAPDLFNQSSLDPATMRSRVTMFDVIRFTEFHRYNVVIVENVVEVTRWELYAEWLGMMKGLGYEHRILSLNSMFFWPTPQSRDRVYMVFWKRGNRAPALDFRPLAPCPEHGHVNALQTWKNGRTIGKYKTQYVYTCPACRRDVTPFYFAALNAIDFTLPAERIGDRSKPLRPRTMERIAYGLKKYGHRQLIVQTNMTSRLASRVRSAEGPMPTQPASVHHAVVTPAGSPFVVNSQGAGARGVDAALPAQMAGTSHDWLALPPNFLVACANGGPAETPARTIAGCDPMRTIHAGGNNHALVQLPGFVIETAQTGGKAGTRRPRELDEAMPTMGAQQSSALVLPFVVTRRGSWNAAVSASEALPAVTTAEGQHGVVQGAPFVTTAGSRDSDAGSDDPMPAQTATERLAVVNPFLVTMRRNADGRSLTEPVPGVTAGAEHHALVQGAALLSLRDVNAMHVGDLSEPTKVMIAAPQSALIATSALPFLTSYYGQHQAAGIDDAVSTVTGLDRHGLVEPTTLRVEDCYFRMLQPHEIGAAMAFPTDYEVGGTKRDRVKQYGNAVTPPVMDWIVGRAAQSLAPELDVPDQVGAA
jgi:DNA (cytosine-5)-methyltransferase 1